MLRDRKVSVNTDQEPPCHVTEQTSHKQASYETITRDMGHVKARRQVNRPLLLRFEIFFYFLPLLPIFRFSHNSYTFSLHHTLPPLVYINPCRGRTLQFKVTTVPYSHVACCAYFQFPQQPIIRKQMGSRKT